jgi:hypothetical protein
MRKEEDELFHIVCEKRPVAGSKYTAKEAAYIYRTTGKRVPV